MSHNMDAAIAHKKLHPKQSYTKVAEKFNVPSSTLYDRVTNTHAPRGINTQRNLSVIQETALLDKINSYAARGTLLTPRHIKQLAQILCGHSVGINWTSTFLRRHRDKVSSKYYRIQELSRLKADIPENRQAFYALVKEVLDTGMYASHDIYNDDETGFELTAKHRQRRVAPVDIPSTKAHAALASSVHITVIASISTCDAPIPPYIIYPGKNLIENWWKIQDPAPKQIATVTDSGFSNSFTFKQWLTDCFEPATGPRANGHRRLLFLDGHDTHYQVDFLEACWSHNIVCIILPANLTSVFQPLDVNFFVRLKQEYENQISDYQLGTDAASIPKDLFYCWHQRAWKASTTSRQIRSAWARTGLFPLSQAIMGARPVTPEQQIAPIELRTPQSIRSIKAIERAVRRHEISPTTALLKVGKTCEKTIAEKTLQEDVNKRQAAEKLEKAARGGKRQRFTQGQVYDQKYQEEHAEELAERKEQEMERREKRKQAANAKGKRQGHDDDQSCVAGPSYSASNS
ncbi:hypothetical protein TREMEDRAFT_26974 [Tremella mesenterica DSM 1558]|uniref:uncharacterized protein n=1 Tax=Tremella mesenterica (strain ATCC 24925 / CBS 8224 / DSM 1558 / NBRC 9311 / NRRL Y-6157 / RJB 2259-6 / UBC 559-6) TaxID=578456 RepID=UPI0003F4A192|nr:uncharacterized protein TREMEDRAFT_26974 [Tremella mesenterica DSM 1558]EIW70990.1 hypothetical protein TREMEDRAFT_26974 [Tremella mesenterica DSM 1558]